MSPETALKLQERLKKEIDGISQMLKQLDQPDAAATMAGLKSGMGILARALLRSNQILFDLTRTTVTPPSTGNPFDRLFR